jgi:pyruvate,water dikinase
LPYIEELSKYEDKKILFKKAGELRERVVNTPMHEDTKKVILKFYKDLCDHVGVKNQSVAVRSSATTEDMEGASFAG